MVLPGVESVGGTGQRKLSKFAVMKDALTKSRKEVSVLGTGQRSNAAVMKDAPSMPRKEEFVFGMGQRSKYAAIKAVVQLD